MPVSFGILQPQPSSSMQVIQTPNYAAQNTEGMLKGIQTGNEAQNSAVQRQAAQLGMLKTQQEMQQSAQKFPGEMQAQTLTNQGLQTKNDMDKITLSNAQLAQKDLEENRAAAKQGIDAQIQSLTSQGHVKEAEEIKQAVAKTQSDILTNKKTLQEMKQTEITNNYTNSQKNDSAMQQVMGNPDVVAGYKNQYDYIKARDPNAPDITGLDQNAAKTKILAYGIASRNAINDSTLVMANKLAITKDITVDAAKQQTTSDHKTLDEVSQDRVAQEQNRPFIQAYQAVLNDIKTNGGAVTGPRVPVTLATQKLLSAAGLPSNLSAQESLEIIGKQLSSKILGQMKTLPRNEKVLQPFLDAIPKPSMDLDTQILGANQMAGMIDYAASKDDFMHEYYTKNGKIDQALTQFNKYKASGEADRSPFINPDYTPPKKVESPSAPKSTPASKEVVLDGKSYVQQNGKWYLK